MISICLPTRGRPERFREMYESALSTATGEIEVVAVFDDDDATAAKYPAGPTYLTVAAGTKQSGLWNVAWEAASGDIAHMGADDLIYRTEGWDAEVTKAFGRWRRDKIGMVYVNDLHPVRDTPFEGQKPSDAIEGGFPFSANPFVTREWIDAVGFFTPPFYRSWEADTWIYQLADGISRAAYVGDVVIEHLHPMTGKAAMDETYKRGAWGDKRLMRQGWQITRSPRMRKLRATQIESLTAAIQAGRR